MIPQDLKEFAGYLATRMATAPTGSMAAFTKGLRNATNLDKNQRTDLQDAIDNQKLKLAEGTVIYTFRLGKTSQDLYETNVSKQKGLVTLHNGKLDEKEYFVANTARIQIATVTLAGATVVPLDILKASFNPVVTNPLVETGAITIQCGETYQFNELSLNMFDTTGRTDIAESTYNIDAPIIFTPQSQWKGKFELEDITGIPANTYVRIVLGGAYARVAS